MTGTRWLDAEEQQTWRTFLLATRLLFAELERDMQQGADMPLTYYEVLSVLSDAPRRSLRMSELAAALQVSPSRVSHAVSRLEAAGWVRRDLCPSDRRSWFAVLTGAGFAVLEAAAPCHVASVRQHLFDQLTPAQLEQLRDIATSLMGHLSVGQAS
ncbi:MAG: MarR family transcriptional regulator [Chloroflexota bacterium]